MTVVTRLKCDGCWEEISWERDERIAPDWLVIGRTDEDEVVHVVHVCSVTCLYAVIDKAGPPFKAEDAS